MKTKKKLDGIIELISNAGKRKGWGTRVANKDEKTFKCASIEFWRYFPQEYNDEKVNCVLDIEFVAKGNISLSIQKTSFHDYGISALFTSIKEALKEEGYGKDKEDDKPKNEPSISILYNILERFDRSARQLRRRYGNRSNFEINDEYDTQDLLHIILKCYFDDVRPEDYTPSYAGSSSKVDFLLKNEKIVIEVKFATPKLKDKHIGEQLIIDINRYKGHPDCKYLVCFVYDPDGNIRNPIGLENDLNGNYNNDKLMVKVIVNPK
jgi:hypothetical protein